MKKDEVYKDFLSTDYAKLYDLVANQKQEIVVFVDYKEGYRDTATLRNNDIQLRCSARGISYFDFYHNKEYLEKNGYLPEKNTFEGLCKRVNLKFIDISNHLDLLERLKIKSDILGRLTEYVEKLEAKKERD